MHTLQLCCMPFLVSRVYTYPSKFLVNSYIVMKVKLRFITFTWTGLIIENMFNYKF